MSWFVFTIHFLSPLADASDPDTRTKQCPEVMMTRGDRMAKRMTTTTKVKWTQRRGERVMERRRRRDTAQGKKEEEEEARRDSSPLCEPGQDTENPTPAYEETEGARRGQAKLSSESNATAANRSQRQRIP